MKTYIDYANFSTGYVGRAVFLGKIPLSHLKKIPDGGIF